MEDPKDALLRLDEGTQRRLILQAAKACGSEIFQRLSASQPTLAELDKEFRENLWACLFLCWSLIPLLMLPSEVFPFWRVRRMVREEWRALLEEVDPECAHRVVLGDVRRIFGKLPRSRRREAKEVRRELDRVSRHWSDLQAKLDRLESLFRSGSGEELEAGREELARRIAAETDAMVLASLQRQLQAVEGQREALSALEIWRVRLQAAQEECAQSLLNLRSRLALVATAGDLAESAAISDASAALQQINTRLTSTQDAVEEVLHLRG